MERIFFRTLNPFPIVVVHFDLREDDNLSTEDKMASPLFGGPTVIINLHKNYMMFLSIRVEEQLAEGAFGPVSKGKLESVPVAIKELSPSCTEEEELAFFREAFIISQFKHANIVRVIAVSLTGYKVCVCKTHTGTSSDPPRDDLPTEYIILDPFPMVVGHF